MLKIQPARYFLLSRNLANRKPYSLFPSLSQSEPSGILPFIISYQLEVFSNCSLCYHTSPQLDIETHFLFQNSGLVTPLALIQSDNPHFMGFILEFQTIANFRNTTLFILSLKYLLVIYKVFRTPTGVLSLKMLLLYLSMYLPPPTSSCLTWISTSKLIMDN